MFQLPLLRRFRFWIGLCALVVLGCGTSPEPAPTCESTSDCSDAQVCREGICLEVSNTCDEASDCPNGSACLGEVCRAPCSDSSTCDGLSCGPAGFCVECSGDTDCAQDEHCSEGACRADACIARSSSCASANKVGVCSDRGDTVVDFACSGDSRCVGEDGKKWCSGWVCTPDQARCTPEGNTAEICSKDGSTLTQYACGNDAVCVDGNCAPLVCTPGEKLCNEGSSFTCNTLGTGSKITDFCGTGEYCNSASGLCAVGMCEPNEVGCYQNQTGVCNELGSAYEELQACESSEVCVGGACAKLICTPGTVSCVDGSAYACNETGTGITLNEACDASWQYCVQAGTYAYCNGDICEGGEPACNGNVLTTCTADGSGYEPGGTTCGNGQVCVDAECKDTVCTSNTTFCESNDVRYCNSTGTDSSLYWDCSSTQYCNAATNGCSTQICTPGAKSCTGNVTRTCNASGSGYETGTNCSNVASTTCEAGECKPVICDAYSSWCDAATLSSCNYNGTTVTVEQECIGATHCYEYSSSSAYCRTDVCTGGAALCSGSLATACAADGSGLVAGGTDCTAAGDACWGGSCLDVICASGQKSCSNGDYYTCVSNGTALSLFDDCTGSEYCDATLGCRPQTCTPNTPTCNGDLLTACAADGSGLLSGGTDCTGAGAVCLAGACQPVVCAGAEWTCQGSALHHCQNRGTLDEVVDTCDATENCGAEKHQCLQRICTPGATSCIDNFGFRTCNETGSGYEDVENCPNGERCEAGVCTTPASACSIADASWGPRTTIRDEPAWYSFGAGVDDADNMFVIYTSDSYSNVQVQRFDASDGIWEQPVRIDQPVSTDRAALAVSGDGSALVAYESYPTNSSRRYDPQTKAWEPSVTWGDYWSSQYIRLKADAFGRFLTLWKNDTTDDLLSQVQRPVTGWSAVSRADTSAWVQNRFVDYAEVDVTPRGYALTNWRQFSGDQVMAWWSRSNLDNLVWETAQRPSGAADSPIGVPLVSFATADGSSATIVYFSQPIAYQPSYAFARTWSSSAGMSEKVLLATVSPQSEITGYKLTHNSLGDAFLFADKDIFRLPAGSTTWEQAVDVGPGLFPSVVAFASGELMAIGRDLSGTTTYMSRYSNGTWTREQLTSYGEWRLLKLSGCRAVLIENDDSIASRTFQ